MGEPNEETKTCELCGSKPEMDFNTFTPLGMMSGHICLACWGAYPDDAEICEALLKKREGQLDDLFGVSGPAVFLEDDETVGRIRTFVLTGKHDEVVGDDEKEE